jgi:hypothetical protein
MRNFCFLWAVVFLGMLVHSQEATSQELEPLEGLQGGLAPLESGLEPLFNPFAPAEDNQVLAKQQKAAEEERERWFRINQNIASNALGLQQQRREKARKDSTHYVDWWAKQSGGGTTNGGGIGLRSSYASYRGTIRPAIPFPVNGTELDKFMWSMSNLIESKGHDNPYVAHNKRTGAYGKYQIIPSTWDALTKEYSRSTGVPLSLVSDPTPFNQEAIARFAMQKSFQKYGNWRDVASEWFSGHPYSFYRNPRAIDDGITNLEDYCNIILQGMRNGQ